MNQDSIITIITNPNLNTGIPYIKLVLYECDNSYTLNWK